MFSSYPHFDIQVPERCDRGQNKFNNWVSNECALENIARIFWKDSLPILISRTDWHFVSTSLRVAGKFNRVNFSRNLSGRSSVPTWLLHSRTIKFWLWISGYPASRHITIFPSKRGMPVNLSSFLFFFLLVLVLRVITHSNFKAENKIFIPFSSTSCLCRTPTAGAFIVAFYCFCFPVRVSATLDLPISTNDPSDLKLWSSHFQIFQFYAFLDSIGVLSNSMTLFLFTPLWFRNAQPLREFFSNY